LRSKTNAARFWSVPPLVYIETSIPSFYFETRAEPEMVARRLWTRYWWDHARTGFDLTSLAVIEELGRGNYPSRDKITARRGKG
jgi:hypothetical protein